MPISGYVLRVEAGAMDIVQERLDSNRDIAKGEIKEDRIPVAAYAEDEKAASLLGEQLEALPGVSAALLVYHNFEDVSYEAETQAAVSSHHGS